MENILILAINPGSTSTKIAVFKNKEQIFTKNINHTSDELARFEKITDQFEFRKEVIHRVLQDEGIMIDDIHIVMGRGGLVRPIPSGVYAVNEKMKEDLRNSPIGEHASNLGGLIADHIARELPNAKAYIANPVVVDELEDVARISGSPLFERRSVFHALNQKAIARKHAQIQDREYEDLNLIVAHLGGGISVGAHKRGRVVDVNHAIGGEGAFSPERAGTLPTISIVELCYTGKYTFKELKKLLIGGGGLTAYLGTNSAYEVEQMVKNGDEKATLIYDAMAYQVSKMIGEMAAVLEGDVDGILVTGGVAYDKWFCERIRMRVHRFAPVFIYPGENEMEALAMNGYRIIRGEAEVKEY
ncbi:MAG: butyrate kinase [Bacteroidales bacterium]|jgi:butyrate kinase|nr:butyrate kinase [Bacteroidales bacterium]